MDLSLFRRPRLPAARNARASDAEAMARLHATAFARPWPAEVFEAALADRAHWGVVLGDEPCRGFALSRLVLDEAELLSVVVAPELRRRGCGRSLLEMHFQQLAHAGARRLFLEVEEGNAPALALYRLLGFRQIGRRRGYYGREGTAADALTFGLDLAPWLRPPPLDG